MASATDPAPSSLAPELQAHLNEDAYVKFSNDEWAGLIKKTADGLQVSQEQYAVPEIGSVAFAKTIDHTLLKLDAVPAQFDDLCAEARVDQFATVCVRPAQVARCIVNLKGTDVRVASVIGFHEGNYDLGHKLQETQQSLSSGAQELDLVINYDQLKAGSYSYVYRELAAIRLQAPAPTLIKLIIETSQLDRSEIIAACTLAGAADLDFVKTSTGFNGPGATEENVRLMAALCEKLAASHKDKKQMKVKASGGIRTLPDAVKMLRAGASRLGASSGVWIAKEGKDMMANGNGPPSAAHVEDARPGLATRLYSSDY